MFHLFMHLWNDFLSEALLLSYSVLILPLSTLCMPTSILKHIFCFSLVHVFLLYTSIKNLSLTYSCIMYSYIHPYWKYFLCIWFHTINFIGICSSPLLSTQTRQLYNSPSLLLSCICISFSDLKCIYPHSSYLHFHIKYFCTQILMLYFQVQFFSA